MYVMDNPRIGGTPFSIVLKEEYFHNEIYLISSDGSRDSVDFVGYFLTDEELIEYAKKDFIEWYFGDIIKNIEVIESDSKQKLIAVYYYESWDKEKEYLDVKHYYTFKLSKWK